LQGFRHRGTTIEVGELSASLFDGPANEDYSWSTNPNSKKLRVLENREPRMRASGNQ
jgi:hypothetical protein